MLRKVLISSIAATALAGSALAADLPSRKAPPVAYVPPPVFTWNGLYVGVNFGGSFAGSNNGILATPLADASLLPGSPFATTSALLASSNNTNGNGRVTFVGGGQIGYNWQWSPLVVTGIEADIQGFIGGRNNNNGFTSAPIPTIPAVFGATLFSTNSNNNRNLSYLGTVRGRLGILPAPNFLLYGTGGLAYGGARTGTITQVLTVAPGVVCTVCAPYSATIGSGGTRLGFAAGVGGEWMFAPNWSAKVEYLYYRLGGRNNNNTVLANFFVPPGPAGAVAWASGLTSGRLDGHIIRAGLNYHFSFGAPGPVVARY
ncbi:MAG: porin family protein [Beijerinckiaceae bacterium]